MAYLSSVLFLAVMLSGVVHLTPDNITPIPQDGLEILHCPSEMLMHVTDIPSSDLGHTGSQVARTTGFPVHFNPEVLLPVSEHAFGGADSIILGFVRTEELDGIADVIVHFDESNSMLTFITDADGNYFGVINPLLDYSIWAEKIDDHGNGVTTLDLIKIQKHLLGIEMLPSPYKLIAADANNSENVSALDLVELRKLILGVYPELPNNKAWRFIPDNFVFAELMDPWPFVEYFTPEGIDTSDIYNFTGVKIGDVNSSAVTDLLSIENRSSRNDLILFTFNESYTQGELIDIPIFAENFESTLGFQFTMEIQGISIVDIIPGAIEIDNTNLAVHDHALTMLWYNVEPVTVDDETPLFAIRFETESEGEIGSALLLSSRITEAEGYSSASSGEEELLDVKFNIVSPVDREGSDIALHPNPVNGSSVQFSASDLKGVYNLDIFGAQGELIASFPKVTSGQRIDVSEIPHGMYIVRVTNHLSGEVLGVEKIVVGGY